MCRKQRHGEDVVVVVVVVVQTSSNVRTNESIEGRHDAADEVLNVGRS